MWSRARKVSQGEGWMVERPGGGNTFHALDSSEAQLWLDQGEPRGKWERDEMG